MAKQLSLRTGWAAVDTDAEVVKRSGMSIDDIFSSQGEPHFRMLESSVLKELASASDMLRNGVIISCGGGLPVMDENYQILDQMGTIVCLYADANILAMRVVEGEVRPLLEKPLSDEKIAITSVEVATKMQETMRIELAKTFNDDATAELDCENGRSKSKLQAVENRLRTLLSQRATTYNRPRYKIDTTQLSAVEVSDRIISLLSLV